ncbi:hypothetical protein AB0L55_36935 [Streptomyces anthocyanicus]|uniref:hypothetical protein n=1 Tax=Streptomyces anthocyanicus TaxID=68174 RepID=UPI00341F4C23
MELVDSVIHYGKAVEDGEMDRGAAIEALMRDQPQLTEEKAARGIDKWRTMQQIFRPTGLPPTGQWN